MSDYDRLLAMVTVLNELEKLGDLLDEIDEGADQ